jgi:hypothetical protein
VDHTVAVVVQQGEIVDISGALAGLMQRWFHMVAFDEALPAVSVGVLEVELASFAGKQAAACLNATNLLLTERRFMLQYPMQAQQVTTLHDALVLVTDKL